MIVKFIVIQFYKSIGKNKTSLKLKVIRSSEVAQSLIQGTSEKIGIAMLKHELQI